MSNPRYFLVVRNRVVTIREIDPAIHLATVANGHCYSREGAWEHAHKLAVPAKSSQDPARKNAVQIEFLGMDGMTTVVKTAQAVQAEWEAGKCVEAPVPVEERTQNRYASPWCDKDAKNLEAIEFMYSLDGKLNEFTSSLMAQFETRKSLSDKQRDCLLNMKEKASAPKVEQPTNDVPAGHYALDSDDGFKFYRVDKPTEGKWAGYTFVKVQASDDLFPVRAKADRERILAAITQNPREAAIAYGRELGKCGLCNRTLTDPESIEAGIGPICAGKQGW